MNEIFFVDFLVKIVDLLRVFRVFQIEFQREREFVVVDSVARDSLQNIRERIVQTDLRIDENRVRFEKIR
jgi:spore cortex formation protein SpoVR/YcgB (stage V sporulation)